MPRDPELERLLKSTEHMLGSEQALPVEPAADASAEKPKSESGSSFMKAVVGLFIVQDDQQNDPQDDQPKRAESASPPPTPNSVEQIAAAIPAPTFAVTSDDMASKDLKSIYHEAGINDSGFTVDKLNELLQDPSLKDQPISTKTLVLKMALKAQNVEPSVPVTDAVQRDRSLDGYQKMLNNRALGTESANTQAIQQINDEVKKYLVQKTAEMDKLRAETAEMKRQAEAFAVRRQEEERRLAEIVIPLLEGQPNPVSIGNSTD